MALDIKRGPKWEDDSLGYHSKTGIMNTEKISREWSPHLYRDELYPKLMERSPVIERGYG